MLASSIQAFPNSIGMLLVPISWVTLFTWYRMFKRFNWLCQRAYDRAKAIEAFFINAKESKIPSLRYQKNAAEGYNTFMINSWINKLDDEGKAQPRSDSAIYFLIGIIVVVSCLILFNYLFYYAFSMP